MGNENPVQEAVLSALALEVTVHRAVLSALIAARPAHEVVRIERDAFAVIGPLPPDRSNAAAANLRRIIKPLRGTGR